MDHNDDNVYILGSSLLEADDQLLISDDFSRGRKQIFTYDDMQDLGEAGILVQEENSQPPEEVMGRQVKEERLQNLADMPSTSHDSLPILRHFMMPDDNPQNFLCTDPDLTQVDPLAVEEPDYFVEHMDIRTPVSALRASLENRYNFDLSQHEFWLQNAQKLEPNKNLVDQCVQGEGIVQINVQLIETDREKRINIIDVLKPTEEYLNAKKNSPPKQRWVVDQAFQSDMERLRIPKSVEQWSKEHVKKWFIWAVRQFNLTGVKLSDWEMTGKQLCDMTHEVFTLKCKKDRESVFWTHLELLRKCDTLAVLISEDEAEKESAETDVTDALPEQTMFVPSPSPPTPMPEPPPKVPRPRDMPKRSRILGSNRAVIERRSMSGATKSGNNGQVQLWQFLLELLTDKNHQNDIYWLSSDGEFKLENPEIVAQLWGRRKQKPAMTYEKLSRALRYYYDGDMIAKVHGKRFVYKFVCDLKQLLGYSASELHALVTECAIKNRIIVNHTPEFYEHS